ncbi:ATP-binding protein [Runella sp. MFBS21]|uniref:hybrid sensor histidine kinase/response regulator transcription factor n=1 Tax=Runella sp. MFBS21 TaxID=3034018 RepID=UPI0023FA28E0|nr:two-component regulator propeller domain-containing protein [Runella sp. MFBS21]MDF7818749.1 ATP-binding protein [Runella sp. MFBS21]
MRFFLILYLYSSFLFAQSSPWQSITISDGLSQGMVYDLRQDREGFMWIATKDGLNRYDGYNFKVFTNDPYNPFSISGNTCTALLEDTKGRIWVGTEKDGLNLYDPKTHKFYHADIRDQGFNNAGNYSIVYLKEDQQGYIWIFTVQAGKYFKINPRQLTLSTSEFSHLVEKVNIKHSQQIPQFIHDNVPLPLQYAEHLYQLDTIYQKHHKILQRTVTNAVLKTSRHGFWAATDESIINWNHQKLTQIRVPANKQSSLNLLNDSTLTIYNQEYVWLLPIKDFHKTSELTPQNAHAQLSIPFHLSKATRTINYIFQDQQNNLWATTLGYGLLKFNPHTKEFQSFLPSYSPAYLYQDRQRKVYIHANYRPSYHFYELDKITNTLKKIPNTSYASNDLHDALLQDSKGHYWLLTRVVPQVSRTLKKYAPNWQLLKQYPIPALKETSTASYRLLESKNGSLWIGYTDGILLYFDPTKEQYKIHNYKHLLPQNGATVETFSLLEDVLGNLWIGTQKGLIKVENPYVSPSFSIYKNNPTNRQSLSNDFVSGLLDDPLQPRNYLWVSTKGGGLERLDKRNGQFQHFTEAQGLPNKVVYGVLSDEYNNLWVSTNRGIARLNLSTFIFSNFNKSDGLQGDEFNTNSYFKASSDEILFGGVNGITIFRPSKIGHNKKSPTVKIIDLKINNKTVIPGDTTGILQQSIEYTSQLLLDYKQNSLTFEFVVMDLSNPIKNRFRYQLSGSGQEWIDIGTNRFANFTQLPYGHYTLKVQGTTDGELWSKPIALHIYIRPPFYRTWSAYLIYSIIICYVLYRLYYIQLNRVRLKEQIRFKDQETSRLAELDTLKTNFFTNISHEFRTPLTLIIGPIQELKKKFPTLESLSLIERNAQRLLTLINQLLDVTKLDAKQMTVDSQPGNLAKFIQVLVTSFQSLAQSRDIQFEFAQNKSNATVFFDHDKFEKIILNLLSNAFKFTPNGGRISLSIYYSEAFDQIKIILKDTGIGIPEQNLEKIFDRFFQVDVSKKQNYEGTGIGLTLVKELVDLLQGSIQVTSQENLGTTFSLSLPLRAADSKTQIRPLNSQKHEAISALSTADAPLTPPPPPKMPEEVLLIVEDNQDLRTYIREIFEDEYQIIEAIDGIDGLEKAMNSIPDIIISDLMMPRMDGFELCKYLKSSAKTSHVPFILLTAKATLANRIEGLELGADDYLIKPFDANELKIRVQNLIKIRRQLQELFSKAIVDLRPTEVKVSSIDEAFLQKAKEVIEKNIADSSFDITQFAHEMSLSSFQLRRKLKALTNYTATEFVRRYRLQRAADLLKQKTGTVSDIAFQVGFESLSYFTKVFQEEFGHTPSELIK